jgi:CDP-diacylglycerol pyrophosphatase
VHGWIATLACIGWLAAPAISRAADPSTLWHIINDRCVPHEQADNDPAPCSLVDLSAGRAHGYVVLKDIRGIAQYLLMPTARIAGIESAEILSPDSPNYWQFAWEARKFVEARLGRALPREAIARAINSATARSQDQLHIHIDCIRPDVKAALDTQRATIGPHWAPLPVPLAGHSYRAIGLVGEQLGDRDPFRLLAESLAGGPERMAEQTLVVVGAEFPEYGPGFVLLAGQADSAQADPGWGEELQDHACTIAGGA